MEEKYELSEAFIDLLKERDVQEFAKKNTLELIEAVFSRDSSAWLSSIYNIKDIIFHVPTSIFWGKMRRYLLGTFHDFEDQIKIAKKFNDDNKEYKKFVLQMLETVDKLDSEEKIDYYAQITRFYLLELIDIDLFYVLRRTIMECTLQELEFINRTRKEQHLTYNIRISSLKQMGLVEQQMDKHSNYYVLSDLALKLKDYALSSDENAKRQSYYLELNPPQDFEVATDDEFRDLLNIFNNENKS